MTDPKQIPHLLKLLDDESSGVREAVAKELAAFGPTLKNELSKISLPLGYLQKEYIGKIFEGHKRVRLKRTWPGWLNRPVRNGNFTEDYRWFEEALSIFAEFLSGADGDLQLKDLLDQLASAYNVKYKDSSPGRLAKFLFKEKKLQGNEDDYHNPQNSNLIYVIQKRKGIPISLAAVYMLVGLRLGIKVEGCHFPGHFLARIDLGGKKVFVDCFSGGQIIAERDLLRVREGTFAGMEKILRETADTRTMVRRFLANLIRAYQFREDKVNSEMLIGLFKDMDLYMNGKRISDMTPEDIINRIKPIHRPGQRVCHVRYGYRGIIVDVDPDCRATDDWYYGNQTQPSRYQPWYHVLVHGSEQVTYVAESHLVKDTSKERMTHPLLSYFFTKTKEGRYLRNDNPWPETDF